MKGYLLGDEVPPVRGDRRLYGALGELFESSERRRLHIVPRQRAGAKCTSFVGSEFSEPR